MSHLTRAFIIGIIGLIVLLIIWLLAASFGFNAALLFFIVSLLVLAWLVWSGAQNFYESYK